MLHRVVLDTNFVMIPGQFGVDIFEELGKLDFPYELCVVSGTLVELREIIEKVKNRDRIAARIGLELIERRGIKVLESTGPVDDTLVSLSGEPGVLIATQDAGLRRRIKGQKLVLRQKRYICMVR
jgi:uncharacterized protein